MGKLKDIEGYHVQPLQDEQYQNHLFTIHLAHMKFVTVRSRFKVFDKDVTDTRGP